ncbi:MAG: SUF system NifU family Fe-S cluster assembly protein [Rhodospirillaceae bacterium]|nr:SUF system NifU family Fe-S cluster assembly protein [Rhodospirillaceae bacterium]MBT3884850.1 SUF system NifU family Fe-S cluster assembly protein [Rhodospirillaceae bacterium]MBT4119153.1 SUF system NifU family Fe-S cluster assembly protein [Rhodospirillaceae bacterium]MBT4674683.1 SUF system NifU family Fe-S cluster assembly protein [Rhodospirillaceae bacterium]MBT4720617.1 SUF system NifU family Fe-S cluster assembly protein [Rhodospirillaceae bacterium]
MDDDIRALYQEVILDHGKNPRNFRHPDDAPLEAHGNNPLCGDKLTVYVRLGEDKKIEDAAFEGRGCAISIASASMMTGILRGKSVAEMERLFGAFHTMCTGEGEIDAAAAEEFEDDIDKLKVLSGVKQFPMRVKCATLAWHTINAAILGEQDASTE